MSSVHYPLTTNGLLTLHRFIQKLMNKLVLSGSKRTTYNIRHTIFQFHRMWDMGYHSLFHLNLWRPRQSRFYDYRDRTLERCRIEEVARTSSRSGPQRSLSRLCSTLFPHFRLAFHSDFIPNVPNPKIRFGISLAHYFIKHQGPTSSL